MTASAEMRAYRRWLELGGDEAQVLAEVIARDARDMGRADAPLMPAHDALIFDTTAQSIDTVSALAVAVVQAALNK